jgi:hypothetical protein
LFLNHSTIVAQGGIAFRLGAISGCRDS